MCSRILEPLISTALGTAVGVQRTPGTEKEWVASMAGPRPLISTAPTPTPLSHCLGATVGRNSPLGSLFFGVRTSGRIPKLTFQGLKFPLVFAQKRLAWSALPLSSPSPPAPAYQPASLSLALEHSGQSWAPWCGAASRR